MTRSAPSHWLGPGVIGVAAFQINVLITYCIGFFAGEHVVASYGYAVRLNCRRDCSPSQWQSFLLPTLAGWRLRKYDDFRGQLDEAVRHLLFVNLPAAALLFVLAEPIVQLLFQYGEFSSRHGACGVGTALSGAALPAYSLVLILGRAFYVFGEVKTPVRTSVFAWG